ncbi:hypothetical protein Cch01nite_26880 [Cellulomonas chitinilytica]|uniref:Uncharacterized protein n=1 Tax=Cellulomonas chitinilytica TaxID=398759 RepID=A0A919P5Y5_9CELL|nr:hypothetical protein [Cellulomonas chitinilytica]GIG21964.1 hypothetical protein Cch01nite_26880 [Cellulomonas chitinilytica]
MHEVPPRLPWQIPVRSDELVASALVQADPATLGSREPRRNGLPDAVVAERHRTLRALVRARAAAEPDVLARLDDLERRGPDTSWTVWQTSLALVHADDDAAVVDAALQTWEALGSNAYALQFKDRPGTYRGFVEGRAWSGISVLGGVAILLAGAEADDRYGIPWWLALPVVVGWGTLVWTVFRATYRRRERLAGTELPHF